MTTHAKTLTQQELRRTLDHIATRKHAERNKTMLLLMYYAGLRVGETAALAYEDVLDTSGDIRTEIRLEPEQTKGKHRRVVFLNQKIRRELSQYVMKIPPSSHKDKLFYSQKRQGIGFTANTLCQFFHYLFKGAGIEGASSHSPRRTFITNLAAQGVGVRVLMDLAGHQNISTTQRYIDVNDEMKRKAIELI